MKKVKVIKNEDGSYYLELCNDSGNFLTFKIRLSQDELTNLCSSIIPHVD